MLISFNSLILGRLFRCLPFHSLRISFPLWFRFGGTVAAIFLQFRDIGCCTAANCDEFNAVAILRLLLLFAFCPAPNDVNK